MQCLKNIVSFLPFYFQVKIGNRMFLAGSVIYIQTIWEYRPALIGIIVGIVVVVLVLLITIGCCCRKHRRKHSRFLEDFNAYRRPTHFGWNMTLINRDGGSYRSTRSAIFRRSQHHARSLSRRLGNGEYGREVYY